MHPQILSTPIEYLKTVGPMRAEVIKKELKIFTYKDLLEYLPFRYVDRTKFYRICELNSDLPYVQIVGRVISSDIVGTKPPLRLVVRLQDNTGVIELVWFKGANTFKKFIEVGKDYVVLGKATVFNGHYNIAHPDIEELSVFKTVKASALQGVYSSTEKLKNKGIDSRGFSKLMRLLIPQVKGSIYETIPPYVRESLKLLTLEEAYIQIHFPESPELLKRAEFRLIFEELFWAQLRLLKFKTDRCMTVKGHVFSKVGECFNGFYREKLPFELTGAQKRVIKEIRHDLGSGKQMNRMLQGDVGSGKTLVALMCMLIAVDNGFQACIMAPTEILANQHYKSISEMLDGLGVNVHLLTGSTKTVERKKIIDELKHGISHIVIGTHALIEDSVIFKNLGLVVIDEQHKFGVAQRARLWKKNHVPPHVLIMTATPIPRTLAMTFYGDLDVSIIDELPPGRKAIKTIHKTDIDRARVYKFMHEQIAQGRQIYVVYPLINESETLDLKDLSEGYENIIKNFPLKDFGVSIVHGQQKAVDKEYDMKLFAEGKSQIMVATTVIEVGVNVPNASVMVIENAERFGLSQLHQLRGRVGRGAEQSYCILMTKSKISEDAKKRMATMVATNDGFKIAETDLELRGPGDVSGTIQSGKGVNIALIKENYPILQLARNIATEIIEADPELKEKKNNLLKEMLYKLDRERPEWSKIS